MEHTTHTPSTIRPDSEIFTNVTCHLVHGPLLLCVVEHKSVPILPLSPAANKSQSIKIIPRFSGKPLSCSQPPSLKKFCRQVSAPSPEAVGTPSARPVWSGHIVPECYPPCPPPVSIQSMAMSELAAHSLLSYPQSTTIIPSRAMPKFYTSVLHHSTISPQPARTSCCPPGADYKWILLNIFHH
jgi:hypothetical protein